MKSSYSILPSRSPGAGIFRIVVVDHQRLHLAERQRLLHHLGELAVDDHHLGLAVVELERDHGGVEPRVDGVEHRARHRHAVVALQHRRRVGQHRRHRVALADAALAQRRGELARPRIELAVIPPQRAVHDGKLIGKYRRCALQQRQWRQRLKIRRIAVEVGLVGRFRHAGSLANRRPGTQQRRRYLSRSSTPCFSASGAVFGALTPSAASSFSDWIEPSGAMRTTSRKSAMARSRSPFMR